MDTGKGMGCNDTSFQCDGSTSTFRVMFKEPVEVLPNTNYIACATLKVTRLLGLARAGGGGGGGCGEITANSMNSKSNQIYT